MFYPTIEVKESRKMHLIRDENKSLCGLTFNPYSHVIKTDLRNIKFRHIDEIDCQACKSILLNKINQHNQAILFTTLNTVTTPPY